jgi:diguanylate cyclase (GGDEF)-like protein
MVAAHLDIERSMREQAAQIEQQTRELEHEMAVRRMAEKQVRHAAFNDHLTGLCNRELLIDRLRRCTTRAQRHKDYRFAVLYMGVDRFKEVNDSLGHSMGDRLLVEMAARLETALKSPGLPGGSECNTIARIGGDDFVVLIEGLQAPSDAIVLAGQLQKLLSTPFDLEEHEVFSTMSIGIATSELDYDSSEELLRASISA